MNCLNVFETESISLGTYVLMLCICVIPKELLYIRLDLVSVSRYSFYFIILKNGNFLGHIFKNFSWSICQILKLETVNI